MAQTLGQVVERLRQGLPKAFHLREERGVRLVPPDAVLQQGSQLRADVLRLAPALVGLLLEGGFQLVVLA